MDKINIKLGKSMNTLSLKKAELSDFDKAHAEISALRKELYKKNSLAKISSCPVCKKSAGKNAAVFKTEGVKYVQCRYCSHCYISLMPTQKALNEFYSKSENYHKTYVDKKITNLRVKEIAFPKVKWVVSQFKKIHGRLPRSFLDVGAGGGHFVKVCRDMGFRADGLEINESSRQFSKNQFGFKLSNVDFAKNWKKFGDYDVITFWSVIAHAFDPIQLLNAASKIISGRKGLVVVEVPRWNSFSTMIQKIFPESVIRHLDACAHIHCFTDVSLHQAFKKNNLEVVSAWYFGMDAYETVIQLSRFLKEDKFFKKMARRIPDLQRRIDLAMLSDEMVFLGKPKK